MGIDLSIIIINWNSLAYLRAALRSIYASPIDVSYEIIVLDNASGDDLGEALQRDFPGVRFIQSAVNRGFAGGNNYAFSFSSGRYALFLNPDTEIVGDAITRMVRFLDNCTSAGIAGPMLLNSDSTVQGSCVCAFPTILSELLDSEALRRRFPRSPLWGASALLDNAGAPAKVDAVSGASLMIRRGVFEAVGMLTVDYFMYAEDVDLCYKARRAGWNTYFLPAAVVVHHGGKSSSAVKDPHFSSILLKESRFRFFRRNRGWCYANVYRISVAFAALVRAMVLAVSLVFAPKPDAPALRRSLEKWRRILAWSFGAESRISLGNYGAM